MSAAESDGQAEGQARQVEKNAKSSRPEFSLARGQVLLVGTGAFAVSALPNWVLLMRMWYDWSVRVCLTQSAEQLVSRNALAAACAAPVAGPEWDTERGVTPHMELADWADLVIVAPATTNFVAKCAVGMPDSLALTTVLTTEAPVVIAPNIPEEMARRPAVQRNLETLAADGYLIPPMRRYRSVHRQRRSTLATGMPEITSLLKFSSEALQRLDTAASDGAAPPDEPANETDARPGVRT